eukprot:scaffold26465_cov59-Phaeocystis_antarctica.AAC.5
MVASGTSVVATGEQEDLDRGPPRPAEDDRRHVMRGQAHLDLDGPVRDYWHQQVCRVVVRQVEHDAAVGVPPPAPAALVTPAPAVVICVRRGVRLRTIFAHKPAVRLRSLDGRRTPGGGERQPSHLRQRWWRRSRRAVVVSADGMDGGVCLWMSGGVMRLWMSGGVMRLWMGCDVSRDGWRCEVVLGVPRLLG